MPTRKIWDYAIDLKEMFKPQKNQENGPKEVFEVEKSVWEGRVRKDADQENLGSCYRSQRDV